MDIRNAASVEGKVIKARICEVIVCEIRTGAGTLNSPCRTQLSVWTTGGKQIAIFDDINTAPIRA